MLKLYDLAGIDPKFRFSPYCWRTKMSLAHKDLEFETIPWRFTEKERISQTGQGKVPVLLDGDSFVYDSFDIAVYLDKTYASRPPLMPDHGAKAAAVFMRAWCDTQLLASLCELVIKDVHSALTEQDQAYFRETREQRFGKSLEELCNNRPGALKRVKQTLMPVEQTLSANEYIGGQSPNFTDFILFGSLMWAHVICTDPPLDSETKVSVWFNSLLDMYGGLGRQAPTVRDQR